MDVNPGSTKCDGMEGLLKEGDHVIKTAGHKVAKDIIHKLPPFVVPTSSRLPAKAVTTNQEVIFRRLLSNGINEDAQK